MTLKQPDAQRPTAEEMAWFRDLGTVLAAAGPPPVDLPPGVRMAVEYPETIVVDCPPEDCIGDSIWDAVGYGQVVGPVPSRFW